MKTIRYILLTMAAAAFATACSEELNPNDINKANPGDEVQFGLSLPGKTKTVYGEETSTGFPIYWVDGDKVKVASPQCQSERNNAEYSVKVESATQNYATSLTKTGDTGVQWGDTDEAVFYSIYPSTDGTSLNISGETVTATLHVDATQFASTSEKTDSENKAYIYAQPAEMGNVVMYAKTTANKADEAVELHYTPFSTVLEFKITAPNTSDASHQSTITIQSLTLTAPGENTYIAGDFGFGFPNKEDESKDNDEPTIEPTFGLSNSIAMHFLEDNQYKTTLSTTKTYLKAKMCVMPISGVSSLKGWSVEVATSAGTFSKKLEDADFLNEDGSTKNTALEPGKVHKIILPQLSYSKEAWNYDPANWIPSLPDYTNIYLSEISLPGAWYAGSSETYQATSDIATLWNAGVRAFAVECRSYTERTGSFGYGDLTSVAPVGVCLSGTGSEKNGAYTTSGAWPLYSSVTRISTIISSVASAINSDEYGVLVLSYADGGEGGHRALDYQNFITGLETEITNSSVSNIYTGTITPETTVNDVLGKLIIKVNIDSNIENGSYSNGMNALFSCNPFLAQISNADFTNLYYSNLYWKTWSDNYRTYDLVENLQTASANENRFIWVFSSANRTQLDTGTDTSIPTYDQRKSALGSMMEYSKKIYDASTHNVWFYFNCGGTEATSQSSTSNSPTTFATEMNDWLLNTAIAGKTDASPLGIVMFNQCTSDTYNGPDIIKAIIEMNSKFYLKHAGTSGTGTGGTEEATATNDVTVQDGGKAI